MATETLIESQPPRIGMRTMKSATSALADRISAYGRNVHQRYPTGDVVVCERDLAEQLRKRPDSVATALDLLLGEQKVQRAPLSGYGSSTSDLQSASSLAH